MPRLAGLTRALSRRLRLLAAMPLKTSPPALWTGPLRAHPRAVTLALALLVMIGVAAALDGGTDVASGTPGSVLAAGPLDGSVIGTARLPESPTCGPNGPAIWLRDTKRLPAAPIVLFLSAGIPVCVVHSSQVAFQHPLVLSWPWTRFNASQRAGVCSYLAAGGTFLAVGASARARTVLGPTDCGGLDRRTALYSRVENVPEAGYVDGGHLRDRQIESLRRFWSAQAAGFRLGDAPGGAQAALAIVHDVRSPAETAAAGRYLAREQAIGVHATYAVQTRVLDDALGRSTLTPGLARLARHVRGAGGSLAAAGVVGGSLRGLPLGVGRESYPAYTPAYATRTDLAGATLFGELRVSRHLVGQLSGRAATVYRNGAERTGLQFSAAAEAAGFAADATLSTSVANGAFPFFQTENGGTIRDLVRFPVSYQDLPGEHDLAVLEAVLERNILSGAPTVAAITPDGDVRKLAAEERLVRALPPGVWTGTLDDLARFVRARARIGLDARPIGRRSNGWLVWITASEQTTGQSLVAPFEIGRAVDETGKPLKVVDRHRIILPPFTGRIAINVAEEVR